MLIQPRKVSLPILKQPACVQAEHIKLIEGSPIDGNTTDLEQQALIALIQKLKLQNPQIFEFGTFDGRTAINLAHHTNGSVFTLDLPRDCSSPFLRTYENQALGLSDGKYMPQNVAREQFRNGGDRDIAQLYSDSATFDFVSYEKRFDFIFIDGAHSKEYVSNDTEVAFRLLKPVGGTIVWHDYGVWPEVTAYLQEKYQNDRRFKEMFQIEDTSLMILQINQ